MVVAQAPPTTNPHLLSWVDDIAKMCRPDEIYWVDGTEEERARLTKQAIDMGVLTPLNANKKPNSFYSRSDPNDVARNEHVTFIRLPTKLVAGKTNNWMSPDEEYGKLREISTGAMKGRTMY